MQQSGTVDREVRDRVRRIETRLTKIGRHMGVDVGGGQPEWYDTLGRVVIPTPNCNVGDIVKVIPAERRDKEIEVYVGSEYLLTLFVDR